jgi:hypothetical protein
VVAVADHERDGRAQGSAVTDSAQELDAILFDLHPAAAAVALLTSREFGVDSGAVDRKTRREAFDDRKDGWTVGFSGGSN